MLNLGHLGFQSAGSVCQTKTDWAPTLETIDLPEESLHSSQSQPETPPYSTGGSFQKYLDEIHDSAGVRSLEEAKLLHHFVASIGPWVSPRL